MADVQAEYPSVAQVAEVVDTPDPVQRNYRITVGYWQLSRAMRGRLPAGANWCAFGTWASRQAGYSIRKQDLERAIATQLRARIERRPVLREVHQALRLPEGRLVRWVGTISQGLPGIDRAANALASGNALIFREIGREFSRYLASGIAGLGDGLRPGGSPGGQDLLRLAFTHYAAAERTDDVGLRAQRMFLSNVQIALHEQMAAQPLLREAMDAALLDVADARRAVIGRLDALVAEGPLGRLRTRLVRRLLNTLADEIAEELRQVVRLVITERLMSLELPNGRIIRLGADVPASFAPSLSSVTDEALRAQLTALDKTPNTTIGSGTADWSNLADRMHFLTDFFRCYHEDPSLFDPPFTDAELAAIRVNGSPESA